MENPKSRVENPESRTKFLQGFLLGRQLQNQHTFLISLENNCSFFATFLGNDCSCFLWVSLWIESCPICSLLSAIKPLSVTNNNVSWWTATASHVGHNSNAHVARSGRLRTDAVICNWRGLNRVRLKWWRENCGQIEETTSYRQGSTKIVHSSVQNVQKVKTTLHSGLENQ